MSIAVLYSVSILLAFMYGYTILMVLRDWNKMPIYVASEKTPTTSVSIIVPARNEQKNILNCLVSLIAQDYPLELFEIIVVDDDSTDETASTVRDVVSQSKRVKVRLLSLNAQNSASQGKKNAIKAGIENSTSRLIITSDADCTVKPNWLRSMVSLYEQQQPKMIIGPVAITEEVSGLELLQSMELMSLIAFTGAYARRGTPIMCNGANLAYERDAFIEVNGFEGIDGIASGDDVLLMNKFSKRFPGKLLFLKSTAAIVSTRAQYDFSQFLSQRKRWASKGAANMSALAILVALIISLINMAILGSLILSIFYGKFAAVFLILFVVKFIVDYALLRSVAVFFNKRVVLTQVLVSQLFYSFYVVLVLILGMRRKYEWKGRIVK